MSTQDIAEALRADECVLLLGPHAAIFEGECLQDLLADRIGQKLGLPNETPRDLPQLARQFANQFKNPTEALEQTGALLRDFYGDHTGRAVV